MVKTVATVVTKYVDEYTGQQFYTHHEAAASERQFTEDQRTRRKEVLNMAHIIRETMWKLPIDYPFPDICLGLATLLGNDGYEIRKIGDDQPSPKGSH